MYLWDSVFFWLFLAALWECTEVLERGHDGTSFYEDRDEDRKENGPILWGVGGAFWQVVKMCICGVGERDRHFRRWMLLMLLMSTNLLNLNWRKQVCVWQNLHRSAWGVEEPKLASHRHVTICLVHAQIFFCLDTRYIVLLQGIEAHGV